ncbi:MAG: alpha/beta fold hydrolase [Verrucomicrobiota bacterium]
MSRNGKALVGIRCLPDGQKELVGVGAGKARVLMTCCAEESLNIASISPDGTVVYVVTDQGKDVQFTRLEEVNIDTGKRTVVGEDPLHAVDLCDAVFDRTTNHPLACRFYRDRSDYVWLSSELEELFNELKSRLPEGDIRFQDSSRAGKEWLISVVKDTEPEAEFLYESATKNLVRLDSRTTPIPAGNLGRMKPVQYKARDKRMISAYLTMPAGSAESHLPVVVFPHGGPNKRNYWGYDARVQFFASRGYAVFQPNFRGSSGHGKDFQNAGNAQWGQGIMQDDISDGVAWLIENGIADPKRIAIVGGSYGGFAALAGLAFTPDLYACGVSLFAASNLPDFVRDIPEDWMPFFGDLAVKVGNPSLPEDARRLARQSPVNFTHQIKVPVMVYHGAKDHLIRQSQADRFVSACRSSGVNVDYLLSPSGGHGFTDPLDEQAVYIAIERFLSEHIGGRRQQDVPRNVEDRLAELRLTGDAALGSRTGGLPKADRVPVPRFPAKAKVLRHSAFSGNWDGRPHSTTFRYLSRHVGECKTSA